MPTAAPDDIAGGMLKLGVTEHATLKADTNCLEPSLSSSPTSPPPDDVTTPHPADPFDEMARAAMATAWSWVLYHPDVTDIWIYLSSTYRDSAPFNLQASAYRIHGQVLVWNEVPTWLVAGAPERAGSLHILGKLWGDFCGSHPHPARAILHLTPLEGLTVDRVWDAARVKHPAVSPLEMFQLWVQRLRESGVDSAEFYPDVPEGLLGAAAVETLVRNGKTAPPPEGRTWTAVAGPPVPPTTAYRAAFIRAFSVIAPSIIEAAWNWAPGHDALWICLSDKGGEPVATVRYSVAGQMCTPEVLAGDVDALHAAVLAEWRDPVRSGPLGLHHPAMVVLRGDRSGMGTVEEVRWDAADVEGWAAGLEPLEPFAHKPAAPTQVLTRESLAFLVAFQPALATILAALNVTKMVVASVFLAHRDNTASAALLVHDGERTPLGALANCSQLEVIGAAWAQVCVAAPETVKLVVQGGSMRVETGESLWSPAEFPKDYVWRRTVNVVGGGRVEVVGLQLGRDVRGPWRGLRGSS